MELLPLERREIDSGGDYRMQILLPADTVAYVVSKTVG